MNEMSPAWFAAIYETEWYRPGTSSPKALSPKPGDYVLMFGVPLCSSYTIVCGVFISQSLDVDTINGRGLNSCAVFSVEIFMNIIIALIVEMFVIPTYMCLYVSLHIMYYHIVYYISILRLHFFHFILQMHIT